MITPTRRKSARPFSLRLSEDLRAHLESGAGDTPLGTYIVWLLRGANTPPPRKKRLRSPVTDQVALAKLLGLLGQTRIPNNLEKIANAIKDGTAEFTPELEAEVLEGLRFVREIRAHLIAAVNLREES